MKKRIITITLIMSLVISCTVGVYADEYVLPEIDGTSTEEQREEELQLDDTLIGMNTSDIDKIENTETAINADAEDESVESILNKTESSLTTDEQENEDFSENQILFNEQSLVASGECGDNLIWQLDDAGILTISGTGDMYEWYMGNPNITVDYYPTPWYDHRSNIKSVIIINGVTNIGNYAFADCSNLKSIIIPNSVTSINQEAFMSCISLTSIAFPNSVKSIGDQAFFDCKSLTNITIPNSVTSIGYYTFMSCTGLTSISIPDSVTSINGGAFYGCSNLKNITIPHSVTTIIWDMFYGCSSLTSITIPDGVTTIGSSAFQGCSSLKNISIPDSVSSIGWYAFKKCSSLKSIYIPDSVGSIERDAFSECWNLTEVRLPKGVGVDYTKATVTGCSDQSYSGKSYNQKDNVEVILNNKSQVLDTDYSIKEENNVGPGKATIYISGKGQNIGAVKKDYLIFFKDVPANHSYKNAVYWATGQGIAAGYSGSKIGYFGVNDNITRGQVVMFLWRAAGKPNPKKNTKTFKDVPTSHNFYKAIQWASEKGIAGGYSNGNFGPKDNCTRGQIAMFLWRYKGKPNPKKKTQTFKDVPTNHSFYKAIQWASEQGITAGYKDGRFGVNDTCTRGQCVTFLYRMLK